jgi:hypothetical protein
MCVLMLHSRLLEIAMHEQLSRLSHVLDFDHRLAAAWADLLVHHFTLTSTSPNASRAAVLLRNVPSGTPATNTVTVWRVGSTAQVIGWLSLVRVSVLMPAL